MYRNLSELMDLRNEGVSPLKQEHLKQEPSTLSRSVAKGYPLSVPHSSFQIKTAYYRQFSEKTIDYSDFQLTIENFQENPLRFWSFEVKIVDYGAFSGNPLTIVSSQGKTVDYQKFS